MIDGITIHYPLSDLTTWKNAVREANPEVIFTVPFELETGSIRARYYENHCTYTHRAEFGQYSLKVLETRRRAGTSYLLKITGSLHKNYFQGENHSRFHYNDLRKEIHLLCSKLLLEPRDAKIHCIEIGVNVSLPFPVSPFIFQALLLHKTTEFISYQEQKGVILGVTAAHYQYSLKCYDKGKQFSLKNPLMRFELRFVKMEIIRRYGITSLDDLLDEKKVANLGQLLFEGWNNILLFEPEIQLNAETITAKERELLLWGSNKMQWANLLIKSPRIFKYRRSIFLSIVKREGGNLHKAIYGYLIKEWNLLFRKREILHFH